MSNENGSSDKVRRQIAREAARLISQRQEPQYSRAKLKAARSVLRERAKPRDLPSNREIREQIQVFVRIHDSDRFKIYEALLAPLEQVKQSRQRHPEGDVLYHSLQVFDLARNELPYDEEFLLAALLHDVGKGLDPQDHVAAALEALDDFITPRTAWLIEHHLEANALRDGTLGVRSRRRLQESEDFEELMLLSICDRGGRKKGVEVPDLDEALGYLRELASTCG